MPEIEKFTVGIETEIFEMVNQLRRGLNETKDDLQDMGEAGEDALEKVGDEAEEAGRKTKSFGEKINLLGNLFSTLIFKAVEFGIRGVQALQNLGQRAIGLQAELEQAEITFTNILGGDQEAALAFLENLRDQANRLKVSFGATTQFAKSILPDTTSVEQFNELLRLAAIGARDANRDLTDLIFSFNEAVAGDFVSIRDVLDIPRDVIAKIREADNTTEALAEQLNILFTKRGINDLSTFQGTLNDTTSSLRAFGENLLLVASEAGFDVLTKTADEFLQVLNENKDDIEAIARAFGDIAGKALDFLATNIIDVIEDVNVDSFRSLADSLVDSLDSVQVLVDILPDLSVENLAEDIKGINETLRLAAELDAQFRAPAAAEEARIAQTREFGVAPLLAPLGPDFLQAIGKITEEQAEIIRAAGETARRDILDRATGAIEDYNRRQEEREQVTEDATDATEEDGDALGRVSTILQGLSRAQEEANAAIQARAEELGPRLIDAQDAANEAIQQNQDRHSERMIEIDDDLVERRLEINEDFNDKLADLDEDIRDRREDIFERTRERLADLENDTNEAIAEERQDFQRDERQDTEDHLEDMRRLREGFLVNLEDAAKNRDARAIVDLRRRFEEEKTERQSDFQTKQSREREDQNLRLQQLRQNEIERADEILRNQQQELERLDEHEFKKRTAIEESRQEALAKADEAAGEARDREDAQFAERQELLEGWLDRELEAIAKNLSDQKDVTSEGAALILQELKDVFGDGGSIDDLMEEFERRRSRRLQISIDFDFDSSGGASGGLEQTGRFQEFRGGIPLRTFAQGGSMVATGPTLALFGEAGPEAAIFAPLSDLRQGGDSLSMNKTIDLGVNFSGSAPPGIGTTDRDAIAAVMVNALREAGIMRS